MRILGRFFGTPAGPPAPPPAPGGTGIDTIPDERIFDARIAEWQDAIEHEAPKAGQDGS